MSFENVIAAMQRKRVAQQIVGGILQKRAAYQEMLRKQAGRGPRLNSKALGQMIHRISKRTGGIGKNVAEKMQANNSRGRNIFQGLNSSGKGSAGVGLSGVKGLPSGVAQSRPLLSGAKDEAIRQVKIPRPFRYPSIIPSAAGGFGGGSIPPSQDTIDAVFSAGNAPNKMTKVYSLLRKIVPYAGTAGAAGAAGYGIGERAGRKAAEEEAKKSKAE